MDELEYKASMYDEIKSITKSHGFNIDVMLKEYVSMRDAYKDKTTYYEIVVSVDKGELLAGDYKRVGIVESYNKANSMVTNNVGDLHEYTYNYAGIIAYRYGVFNYPISKEVYKYDHDKEKFYLIEEYDGIGRLYERKSE
jgi:hypothetical protein